MKRLAMEAHSVFTTIVLAVGLVVVTGVIAKVLRIGSDDFYGKQTERGQLVGRHCCLSGLADLSEDLRKDPKAL